MANARYCSSEVTGTATSTINGRSFTTGADTAFQASTNPATDDGGANSGTDIATPCLSLAQAILFITEDTDIYCAGRFRVADATTYAALVDADNTTGVAVRFLQWPGKAEAHVTGANKAGTSGWASSGAGYTKTIATGLTISDVMFDWDATGNIDSTGRRISHLALAANAAAALATGGAGAGQGGYFYDSGTGVLSIGLKNSGDPNSPVANGIEYVVAGRAGIVFDSTLATVLNDGCAVSGIRFSRWGGVSDTSPAGSSLAILYGQNCSVTDCIFEDSQRHAFAFGGAVVNQNASSCSILGAVAGSVIAVYNASGGSNSASGTFSDSTIEAYRFLGHDGLKTGAVTGIIGFYVHGTHNGVVMRNVTMNTHDPASGTPASFLPVDTGDATAPASLDSHASYPVRVENCTFNGCTEWYNETVTTYISFRNCSVFGTQTNQVYQVGLFSRSSATGRWRFEGCQIAANLANSSGGTHSEIANIGTAFTMRFLNCSLYDTATSHSASGTGGYAMFRYAAAPNGTTGVGVIVNGCILGFRATDRIMRVTNNDAAIASTYRVFGDNIYFNCGYSAGVAGDHWCQNTSYDSAAEWLSGIDTGQVNNATTNPYADTTGASLAPTAAAKLIKKYITPHTASGINGPAYSRNYGAFQYGEGTYTAYGMYGMVGLEELASKRRR